MRRPTWCATFLIALEHDHAVSVACTFAEVSRATVYERRAVDPSFARDWEIALQNASRFKAERVLPFLQKTA